MSVPEDPLESMLSFKAFVLYGFVGCALFAHFRGRDRHGWKRQLTDHSTFAAPYNVLMYLFSAVPNRPYTPIERFPELRPLLENWKTLRDDAVRLYEQGHVGEAEERDDLAFNSLFRRGWRRFYLKWYDECLPSAQDLCPQSAALVDTTPSVNAALFALLPPKAQLKGHRDPFAGSLRLHLGLSTPNSDDCYIDVDGVRHSWRDGEAVVFDETYIHRAANRTDAPRIILFCDIDRPLRTAPLRAVNRFVKRTVMRATAGRNVPTERRGGFNRFTAKLYGASDALHSLKRRNRRLYKVIKYGGIAALVALFFVL